MNTKIYSVFPACGKTWLYEHQEDYGLTILDSDSSEFSWIELRDAFGRKTKLRNPDFPVNYIKYIRDAIDIGWYDCIFVSSHASVREALDKEGIDFTIVYPMQCCKDEWVGRCYAREKNGESGCNANVMYDNFDDWILECIETGINHKEVVLLPTTYLSDCFKI